MQLHVGPSWKIVHSNIPLPPLEISHHSLSIICHPHIILGMPQSSHSLSYKRRIISSIPIHFWPNLVAFHRRGHEWLPSLFLPCPTRQSHNHTHFLSSSPKSSHGPTMEDNPNPTA